MTKCPYRLHRHLPKGLLSIVMIALCLQLLPAQAVDQSKSASLLSRYTNRTSNGLKASFAYSPSFPAAGNAVQFKDYSTGSPSSWQWDFGDGTVSTQQNPIHVFAAAGFRRVILTVGNGSASRRVSRSLAVLPKEAAASFAYSPSTPGPGQSVQFADTSSGNPTSWSWSFGDGSTSALKNPSHSFGREGAYLVSLISTGGNGSKQASKTITVVSMSVLTSAFTFTPALPSVGQSVQFMDASTGSPTSWSWSFGDGTTSTAQNPSHAYAAEGVKTVTLTVTNSSGSNTSARSVTVAAALTASFNFNPAAPVTGQAIQFTDTSTGSPTSWSWSFGDGTMSTAQNPSHAFTAAGTKTVSLTVTNSSGSNLASRTILVTVPLAAAFSYSPASPVTNQSVQFTDTSTGSPSIWQWSFGDGSSASTQNPSHTFAAAGSYSVTLTVMNASGQNSVTRTVTVTATETLAASFSYSPASPAAGQSVQFTDTSTGTPTSWSWSFGDGGMSTAKNPSHAYASAGSYTVSLTATAASGTDTASQVVTVIPSANLTASFSFSPSSPAPGQAVAFTDTSTGTPTSWQWSFGDGGTSTAQSPSHTFTTEGSYAVTLIAGNATGTDTVSRTVSVASTSDVIPQDRLYDWTYAGIPGGIPARATIYTTLSSGATAAQINSAIAACPSGQVVYLSAGTYSTGQITFGSKSGVTLRGAGAGKTILRPTTTYAIAHTTTEFSESAGITVASGYTKGSTVITLASAPTSSFVAGRLIVIAENASANKWGTGVGTYYRTGFPTGSNVYDLTSTRIFHYTSRIVSVSGNTITLASPIPLDFTASLNVKAYATTSAPTSMCGVENMTIDCQNNHESPIRFQGADRCWVKNVEIKNVEGSDIGQIKIDWSFQIEIRRCYIHNATGWPNQADGYASSFNYGCSNCLIVDCVTYRVADLCETNGASGCAYLYNYGVEHNRASDYARGITLDHGPHGYMNLAEGNILCNVVQDGYHGSTSHGIMFRNHLNGENMAQPKILNLCRGAYYFTVAGNVLGDSSWNPRYYEQPLNPDYDSAIYVLGFPTADSTSLGGYSSVPWNSWSKSTSAPDADVKRTLLRHGNYDYFNKTVMWDSGIASHALPDSLVYASKPSFFGTLQWPPIGPDVSGLVTTIPAKTRWNAYLSSGLLDDLFKDF
jgi:PKD repeat protein